MNDPLMVALALLFFVLLGCLLLVFLLVNIWQRQRAEEALRNAYTQLAVKEEQNLEKFLRNEGRFRLVAETACDLLYEYDWHRAELTWFGDVDAALGFEADEFPRTLEAWQERIHPEDREHLFKHALRKRRENDALHFEYRIKTKQGEWRYWEDRSAVLFDAQGQPSKLMGGCNDITALRLREQMLRNNETKYRNLIESLGSEYFFYRHDADGVFTYISPSIKHILGYSQAEFLFHYAKYYTDNPLNVVAEKHARLSMQGQKQPPYEIEIHKKNGGHCRLRVSEFPVFTDDGQVAAVHGIAQDISVSHQLHILQKGRTDILEMIAQAQPLPQILHTIVTFLESAQTDMLCSIMLFDPEHHTLSLGAAPSLLKFFSAEPNGIPVAEGVGACGTAAFRRERVITEDILQHPYWQNFREMMAKTPLRSCWSEPIFSRSGEVLGTFAMYAQTPHLAHATAQHLVKIAVSLAAIAIDQHNNLQALQDSEKRLLTLIEALPDAIYFKDGKGRWQVVNAAGLQAFNLQGLAWQGKTEWQLAEMQPELRTAHEACIASDEKAWQQTGLSQVLEEMLDTEGHTHYFDVTKVPLFTAKGERQGLVIIGRNVTAQKQLEATLRDNQRHLQEALNAAGAGTFLYDTRANTICWDQRSLAMFGKQAHEFAGNYEAWRQCVHAEDLPKIEPIFQQALLDKDSVDVEYRAVHPDHSIRHIKAQAQILRDANNAVLKVSGLHFDITQRKQAEAELKQARDNAEAASRAKSAFLATMSHELRTPLNSILGYAQILLQATCLDATQHEQLHSIQQNGQQLLMLINDVLDFSKIESGKIELQPHEFLLTAFFQDISHYFSLNAAKKHLEFIYESGICADSISFPQVVRADEKRLRQILFNLLSNAIKFTQHGSVKLTVKYYCNHQMEVSVEDSGCGIEQSDLALIFLPFQKLNQNKYLQGTGLGLAITHRLLQLMEAELQVTSHVNQGSRFSFIMPLDIISWEKNHIAIAPHMPMAIPSLNPYTVHLAVPQLQPTVLKNFCAMAELGDVTAIIDYANKLQKNACVSENAFYTHLATLAQGFKIDELQSFLQQACHLRLDQNA